MRRSRSTVRKCSNYTAALLWMGELRTARNATHNICTRLKNISSNNINRINRIKQYTNDALWGNCQLQYIFNNTKVFRVSLGLRATTTFIDVSQLYILVLEILELLLDQNHYSGRTTQVSSNFFSSACPIGQGFAKFGCPNLPDKNCSYFHVAHWLIDVPYTFYSFSPTKCAAFVHTMFFIVITSEFCST